MELTFAIGSRELWGGSAADRKALHIRASAHIKRGDFTSAAADYSSMLQVLPHCTVLRVWELQTPDIKRAVPALDVGLMYQSAHILGWWVLCGVDEGAGCYVESKRVLGDMWG